MTPTLKKFTNFTGTSAGLEKTIRFIQALVQIVAAVTPDDVVAERCLMAKSQFALARRYFRFFNFIPSFDRVFTILGGDFSRGMFLTMIDVARFTALGLYFILEDLTILHALNIWPVPWSSTVLVEANKFWFYALALSVFGAVYELVFHGLFGTKGGSKNSSRSSKGTAAVSATSLVKRIVVDGCDLLIPGSFLHWTPFSDFEVGQAMVVSTAIASRDIWAGVR